MRRTALVERAPFFASRSNVDEALRLAEAQGHFRVDDVNPAAAARRITVPVLLVHGDKDKETPYAHALRILAALHDPKWLVTIPGGGHQGGLTPEVWRQVDRLARRGDESPLRADSSRIHHVTNRKY